MREESRLETEPRDFERSASGAGARQAVPGRRIRGARRRRGGRGRRLPLALAQFLAGARARLRRWSRKSPARTPGRAGRSGRGRCPGCSRVSTDGFSLDGSSSGSAPAPPRPWPRPERCWNRGGLAGGRTGSSCSRWPTPPTARRRAAWARAPTSPRRSTAASFASSGCQTRAGDQPRDAARRSASWSSSGRGKPARTVELRARRSGISRNEPPSRYAQRMSALRGAADGFAEAFSAGDARGVIRRADACHHALATWVGPPSCPS